MRPRDHFVGHAAGLFTNFIVPPAHEPLDRIHGVLRIRYRLTFRYLADQPLARLGDGHYGRRRPRPLLVGDHHRLAALHHGHYRVRRSQVNSNNLAHCCHSSSNFLPFPLACNSLKSRRIQPSSRVSSLARSEVYMLSVCLSSLLIAPVSHSFSWYCHMAFHLRSQLQNSSLT